MTNSCHLQVRPTACKPRPWETYGKVATRRGKRVTRATTCLALDLVDQCKVTDLTYSLL